jgi:predicted metalloprotease with PDZ domain
MNLLRRSIFLLFLSLAAQFSSAHGKYMISLDLKKVVNDRVKVVMQLPEVSDSIVEYVMPAVIPGSYSRKDYGRFVTSFKVYSSSGRRLQFTKSGENVFVILNPNKMKLGRIEYWVNDTWDAEKDENKKQTDSEFNYINQSGGTNIEKGRNFVINHQGYYGYLEGYKLLPYEITVKHPDSLYASTSLKIDRQKGKDILYAKDYVFLVDNPVMYCRPDTVSFSAGGARITVSVYSETGVVRSGEIKKLVTPLSAALARFFGKMPVNHYTFIMYFAKYGSATSLTRYGSYGALEHSYSSFYFLPELPEEAARKEMVLGVASHEFLHILTPLNIHSEEISNFDFRNPKMSKHLWMYEGVTEYLANLVPLKDTLMTYNYFMDQIRGKIEDARKYPDISFTEMSRNILDSRYKQQYPNVYQKGALIGFLLDIRLTELSGGKEGLRELMLKLKEKYGVSKPFRDDQLIDDIVSMTHPSIEEFFTNYVEGSRPLPLQEYFGKIGWVYRDSLRDTVLSFGSLSLVFNDKEEQFKVSHAEDDNVFSLREGDIVLSVNGKVITLENYDEVLDPLYKIETSRTVTIKYKRNSEVSTTSGVPRKVPKIVKYVLRDDPNATPAQKLLRSQVLGSNNSKQ